jgi:radical SAM superfamily enzyme YgiQ (UPF0313 family)
MEQLGLSYIAATARESRLSVEIVDGFLEPDRYVEVLSTLQTEDYYLLGFPIYHETVQRVAKDVRKLRDRGVRTHVVVGNYLATLSADQILLDFSEFDSAIRGEGEYTVTQLAECIATRGDFSSIAGLTYRTNSRVVSNQARPNVEDLDSLPFPARDTLPLVLKAGNAPLVYSSRGCNAKCDFCSVHKFYRLSPNGGWRARSANNVVDEMEQISKRFGVTEFAFADEQFMGHGQAGVNRALSIAQNIIDRQLNFSWYIETRSSDVTLPVFSKLYEGGLRAVFMGMESGYDPALRTLKKGIRASQHLRAIEVLKQLEILPSIGFIMFRPDTTIDELECNLTFLEEIGCGEITALVTQLKVYCGTDLETSLLKNGWVYGTYVQYKWDFMDSRVKDCFRIVIDSADTLSVSYNEFASLRRLGLLTYQEGLELQRVMNSGFVSVVRGVLKEIVGDNGASEGLKGRARDQFRETCEDFLRLLRFVGVATANRRTDQGFKLLNPMSLC